MGALHGDAMEVLARADRCAGQTRHPLHDHLQGLCEMGRDGSLWQAFVASVQHLAATKQLDLRILHGDGTNTVAKKGAMVLATRAINTRKATKSSPSLITMATS